MKRILFGIACIFWVATGAWAADFPMRPAELAEKYNKLVRAYGWSSPIALARCTDGAGCTYSLDPSLSIGLTQSEQGNVNRGLVFYSAAGNPDDNAFLDAIAVLGLVLSDQESLYELPASMKKLFPPGDALARAEIVVGGLRLSRETLVAPNGFLVTITKP